MRPRRGSTKIPTIRQKRELCRRNADNEMATLMKTVPYGEFQNNCTIKGLQKKIID